MIRDKVLAISIVIAFLGIGCWGFVSREPTCLLFAFLSGALFIRFEPLIYPKRVKAKRKSK